MMLIMHVALKYSEHVNGIDGKCPYTVRRRRRRGKQV